MTYIEKTIKGLTHCTAWGGLHECQPKVGDDCPYEDEADCKLTLMRDALALLKEQAAKTGKWIPIESTTGVEAFGVKEMTVMNVRCSVCGSEEDVSFTGYKYCPRCGAKMEGR